VKKQFGGLLSGVFFLLGVRAIFRSIELPVLV